MHPALKEIFEPAYRCVGFDGTCNPSMRWAPHKGHTPRGFYGATGDLEEVVLVLVLAEPGNPSPNPGPEECYADVASAFAFTGHCYLNAGGPGHENVRIIVRRCFPDLSLVDAIRKVWITESVLCSAPSPGANIKAGIERFLRRAVPAASATVVSERHDSSDGAEQGRKTPKSVQEPDPQPNR